MGSFMRKTVIALILIHFLFSHAAAESNTARVLLYHHISATAEDEDNPYIMPLSSFTEQMEWLSTNGYSCLTVSQLYDAISSGTVPEKSAVITFDDGYPDVYFHAFPVLAEYGFPATEYLVAGKIGRQGNLSPEMIREMHKAGWEIGIHGMTHSPLTGHDDLDTEICRSRFLTASLTGIPMQEITSFAYPYGSADETVMNKVWKCGYQSGAGLGQIPVDTSQNRFYFARHPVTSDMTLGQFAALFDSGITK